MLRPVSDVGAGFDGLHVGHEGKAGGAVGVDDDGQIHRVLDGGDEIIGLFRAHDAGHVLDADRGGAHLLELFDHLDVLVKGVHGRGGVGNGAGCHGAGLDGLLDGDLEVGDVVESVENADDVDAVADGGADKAADDIVAVVLVAQDVLAAEQHLQLGVGHGSTDLAQALPRILIQEAQAHVERGAAPAFHGVKAGLVDGFEDGLKLVEAQPRCDK